MYAFVHILAQDKAKTFLNQKVTHPSHKSHQKAASEPDYKFSCTVLYQFLNSCRAMLFHASDLKLSLGSRGPFFQFRWKLSY